MKHSKSWAVAAVLLALTSAAQAELFDRGGGMIYDSTNNVTWLADTNYARTSGYDSDGYMTWSAAKDWAGGLSYGGYNDWRLATLNPFDESCSEVFNPGGGFPAQHQGLNCTGGELSHLFVADFGLKGNESVLDQTGDTDIQKANLAMFSNVQPDYYWSGTEYSPNLGYAWLFLAYDGVQFQTYIDDELYAMAVRDGDVTAVPEPQTYVMLLLGLSTLLVEARRRLS